MTGLRLRPRVKDGAERAEQLGKVSGLLFQQRADVRAWGTAITPLGGDLRDLGEGQAETPSAGDETKDAEHVGRIHAIAGCGTAGVRDDAARLIESERLPGDSAALGHVANQQAVCHVTRIDLAPYGKVKWWSDLRACQAGHLTGPRPRPESVSVAPPLALSAGELARDGRGTFS